MSHNKLLKTNYSPRNYLIDDGYGSSNTSNELSHQNNMPVESTWYSKSRSRRSSAFMNIDEIKKLAKLKRDEKEYMEFDSPPCGQRMTVYACSSIKQYEQRYGHLNGILDELVTKITVMILDLDIIQNVAPNLVNLLQETGIEQQQEPIIEQTNEPQLLIPKKRRRSMVQIPSLSQIDPHELKENDENRLFKKSHADKSFCRFIIYKGWLATSGCALVWNYFYTKPGFKERQQVPQQLLMK
jgi:hypothetical protein